MPLLAPSVPTFTLEPLVQEPVEQRATVVTEGGGGVGVQAEAVLGTQGLHRARYAGCRGRYRVGGGYVVARVPSGR